MCLLAFCFKQEKAIVYRILGILREAFFLHNRMKGVLPCQVKKIIKKIIIRLLKN